MDTAELDDLLAFNDQLLALVEAGVSIDVGQEVPVEDLSRTLEKINATIARRVSRRDSLEDVLASDDSVPMWYRNLVLSGLGRGNRDASLRAFSRVANSADESRFVTESALFYPLIVCSLAYLGMVGFCLFFTPTLEAAYVSFEIRPGTGLVILQKLRDTLPIWVAIPPLLLLLFVGWRYRAKSRRVYSAGRRAGVLTSVSGISAAMFKQRCAYFAESLASLEESDIPLETALPLAAGASGDVSLAEGSLSLAASIASGQPANECGATANRFPPFLRWALCQSEATVGRDRALRIASMFYQESSNRGLQRARTIAPIVGLVILGGSVTLIYGLALFMPVVQMLKGLAATH
jgi:type II secretory pathway component PulF